jgi:nicotinamide-nucleotide amidase
MQNNIIFVGSKFKFNQSLGAYIIREVEQKVSTIDEISYFGESDNRLFLHLETSLQKEKNLLIFTTKNSFSTVGKLLCTVTSDNQVLKEEMLIPSQSVLYEKDSYLLQHESSNINVIAAHEGETLASILIQSSHKSAQIQIFDETLENAMILLEPLAQTFDVKLSFTPLVEGWITLTILSRKFGNISKFIDASKKLLNNNIIAASDMSAYIIKTLGIHQKKLTFAESCTGGQLAAFLTQKNGASTIFDGSLVTYSNALKSNWLAVDDTVLEKYGAVSSEVVSEMSEGALNVSYADYAISVSGIAGPEGGTKEKPVGTIFIGVRSNDASKTEELHFNGDRNYIQQQSVYYAIKMLVLLDRELFFKKS